MLQSYRSIAVLSSLFRLLLAFFRSDARLPEAHQAGCACATWLALLRTGDWFVPVATRYGACAGTLRPLGAFRTRRICQNNFVDYQIAKYSNWWIDLPCIRYFVTVLFLKTHAPSTTLLCTSHTRIHSIIHTNPQKTR